MVLHLVVVAVLGAVEVGDGFDFAAVHLHEYATSPLGLVVLQRVAQRFLHDVLQVGIDGGAYVVAVLRLANGYVLRPAADTLACTQSLFAFQFVFKRHLKSRVAVAPVAVDTAYRAARERAEGLDTLVLCLKDDTASILSQFEKFESLQLSFLQVVDTFVAKAQSPIALVVTADNQSFVFFRCMLTRDVAQLCRKGVNMGLKEFSVVHV